MLKWISAFRSNINSVIPMRGDLKDGCPLGSAPPAPHTHGGTSALLPRANAGSFGCSESRAVPNGELPIHWGAAASSVAVQALEEMKLKEISGGKINILMHVKPLQRELSFAVPRGFAHH